MKINQSRIKPLLVGLIVSFVVAVVLYVVLFTNVSVSLGFHWTYDSSIFILVLLGVAVLNFCILGICVVVEWTRNKAWAHKPLITRRAILIALLIACYVGIGVLVWSHLSSVLILPHKHPDLHMLRYAVDGGSIGYIFDAQGNLIVDADGKYVEIYFKNDDKNGHVVRDELGRLITTDKDPLIKGTTEDVVYQDPFEKKGD